LSFISRYQQLNQTNPESSLKEEVKGILRDYRHFWDVYAELLQNSVDSINRRYRIVNDPNYYLYTDFHNEYPSFLDDNYVGKIEIRIDTSTDTITILDNGVGIKPEDMPNLLLPKYSGKKIKHDYGFKGYGLTFVSFISRAFTLKSRYFTTVDAYNYSVSNVFDWVTSDTAPFPTFPDAVTGSQDHDLHSLWNTKIEVRLDNDYQTRFDAVAALDVSKSILENRSDLERFKYILRTKTALGNTKGLFSLPPLVPIEIKLQVTFPDGSIVRDDVPYSYYHPMEHQEISVNSYEFGNYITQAQAANFIRGFRGLSHSISPHIVGTRNPISCNVFLSAISSTRLRNIEEDLRLSEIEDPGAKISNGIFLSIDGMPTGIRLDSWDKKGGSYKRYYVIVDCSLDISNTLDSGRKGITSHYANLIDQEVIDLLNETRIGTGDTFSSYASRDLDIGRGTPPGGGGLSIPDFQADINSAKANIQYDLQNHAADVSKVVQNTPLLGIPHSEQEVVVLFFSLLAKGIIKGYNVVYSAGSEKVYDAAFSYKIQLAGNTEPDDPIGIGRLKAQTLANQRLVEYDHSQHYAYNTVYPEICVEFKKSVGGLLYELNGQSNKDANQIDLLIVWDTSIPSQIPSNSYTLTTIQPTQRIFHGATHRLGILGARNTDITVISLKDVLNQI
jgi:hypothetical protein